MRITNVTMDMTPHVCQQCGLTWAGVHQCVLALQARICALEQFLLFSCIGLTPELDRERYELVDKKPTELETSPEQASYLKTRDCEHSWHGTFTENVEKCSRCGARRLTEAPCEHEFGSISINNAESPIDPQKLYTYRKCVKCGEHAPTVANRAVETKVEHDSDCAIYGAPALPVGPCNCGLKTEKPALMCHKCGANRYWEPCKGNAIECPIHGETQANRGVAK